MAFFNHHDPFASLKEDSGDVVDFEDTYDGLGDQLEETGDDLNDETFGGGGDSASQDFDFFGATARVADALGEENQRFNRDVSKSTSVAPPPQDSFFQQPVHQYRPVLVPVPAPSVRTGYEKYKEPNLDDLEVDLSLWGITPTKPAAVTAPVQPARKVMSLEEVEANMRAARQQQQQQQQQQPPAIQPGMSEQDFLYAKLKQSEAQLIQQQKAQQQLQQQQQPSMFHEGQQILSHLMQNPQHPQHPQHHPVQHAHLIQQAQVMGINHSQINQLSLQQLQHLTLLQGPGGPQMQGMPAGQNPIHSIPLTAEQKAMFLDQEAKRAKRNHKIWLLSKVNGLMTPQDKNFITRIQLQQLVTATGISTEPNDEAALNDDFYYQVHTSISGGQRMGGNQPLNNFAQTYLNQTGNRHGRRHGRQAENHVQRMEQQVQRAVEAAKNKPKKPQLVVAGSLGKISFSNAKTPKPLLNIRKLESNDKKPTNPSILDRKAILRNIENVYDTLMKLEDHGRLMPRAPMPGSGVDDSEFHVKKQEWEERLQTYSDALWDALKVHEPIGATSIHPFIAFLSFGKGKRAIPRVFNFASVEQRITILTMIVYHLDKLDVVAGAQIDTNETALNSALRENIELFSTTVMPSLFRFLNESDLTIVDGLLDIISTQLNLDLIARTRIGTSMLTLILSRAELLKQAGSGAPNLWAKWEKTFGGFFDRLAPILPYCFPSSIISGEDIYVWQLLAAMGVSASSEQQQRLVPSVKDRVLNTVAHAKTLPMPMSAQRLANVNLFMQSIGLDVELLG